MPYRVIKLDLTAVTPSTEIAPAQTRITELFVLDIPLGQSFSLKVGRNSDFITITRPFSMEPTGEEESNNGLSWKNDVAQPGIVVELVVVTGNANQKVGAIL